MTTIPQALPQQSIAPLPRTSSVVMGRQDYLSTVLRLIGMELYKIRRRAMSKVLAIIALALTIVVIGGIGLVLLIVMNQPASSFSRPLCSQSPRNADCVAQPPTQAQLEQLKARQVENISQVLRLPMSLSIIENTIVPSLLTLLIVILVGTIVGGEYGLGTVRLLFTRGPTRTQFLLGKIGAAIVCIVLGVLVVTLVGVLLGYALNPISGITPDFHFFNVSWLGYTLLLLLAAMLGWFVYAMVALFFGTLGRSTAAGIAGGLVWLFIEPTLGFILSAVANLVHGTLGDVLKAIPDYLIGKNVSALVQNQLAHVLGVQPASGGLSDLHALLVLAGYLVVFIGLSWLITVRRDVTN